MAIKDVENSIRHGRDMIEDYYDLVSLHETSTRYAIIDPILWAVDWKTWNPNECELEYQRGQQGRVDYALFDRQANVVILVEAKRLDKNSANSERQLSQYARGIRQGMGVLTDGEIWHLYDLSKGGRFESKYVDSVDICEDSVRRAAQTLNMRLGKSKWW